MIDRLEDKRVIHSLIKEKVLLLEIEVSAKLPHKGIH
jgi:hypothetical protein